MKKFFVSILVFSLAISGLALNASANTPVLSLDGNSAVSSTDALMILQHSVGIISLTDEQLIAADYNKDNKVNSTDALFVLHAVTSNPETEDTDASDKTLYYYEDGTTGYEPKPGAKYKDINGVWVAVSWGDNLTDEELKDLAENCPTGSWQ